MVEIIKKNIKSSNALPDENGLMFVAYEIERCVKMGGGIGFVFKSATVIAVVIFVISNFSEIMDNILYSAAILITIPFFFLASGTAAFFGILWNIIRRDRKNIPNPFDSFRTIETYMLFPALTASSFALQLVGSRGVAEQYISNEGAGPITRSTQAFNEAMRIIFDVKIAALSLSHILICFLIMGFMIYIYNASQCKSQLDSNVKVAFKKIPGKLLSVKEYHCINYRTNKTSTISRRPKEHSLEMYMWFMFGILQIAFAIVVVDPFYSGD